MRKYFKIYSESLNLILEFLLFDIFFNFFKSFLTIPMMGFVLYKYLKVNQGIKAKNNLRSLINSHHLDKNDYAVLASLINFKFGFKQDLYKHIFKDSFFGINMPPQYISSIQITNKDGTIKNYNNFYDYSRKHPFKLLNHHINKSKIEYQPIDINQFTINYLTHLEDHLFPPELEKSIPAFLEQATLDLRHYEFFPKLSFEDNLKKQLLLDMVKKFESSKNLSFLLYGDILINYLKENPYLYYLFFFIKNLIK